MWPRLCNKLMDQINENKWVWRSLYSNRSNLESVNEFKEWMESALKEVKAALSKSKDDMMKYYDQKGTPALDYQPRDKVYLDASGIQTTRPSKKLSHWRLGPFPVVRKVRNGAYWLQLPPSMSRLHPVFNVVKLIPPLEDPVQGWHMPPPCVRGLPSHPTPDFGTLYTPLHLR